MRFKPYDLVAVQHDWGSHYGEVISKPYEDDDGQTVVQVRMVINDPSTMHTIAIDRLNSVSRSDLKWVQYAVVTGQSPFPIDMLRYDCCHPVNFEFEMDKWGDTRPIPRITVEGDTQLIVGRATYYKAPQWTVDRWLSFDWGCEHLKSLKIEKGK